MRIVLDTNVLISGLFFTGPPRRTLAGWRSGRVPRILSEAILDEYQRVGEEVAARYSGVDPGHFLSLVALHGELCVAPPLAERVCEDPDDDQVLACAVAAGGKMIVSTGAFKLRNGQAVVVDNTLSPDFQLTPAPEDS
ncbi:MAG TPA: putative toxin-antitoxin system toxin component, PIN family [Nitrospiraceae bacterium]